MGKKKADKPLTHEEIWDDSALVQSWDDAVEEYKHYHSIHAKGENVEDVLREAQEAEQEGNGDYSSQMEAKDAEPDPVQASVTDESNATQTSDSMNLTNNATASSAAEPDQAPAGPEVNMQMPAPILAQVKDESLKNLMMSWYYAGYYTGLHEGRQQVNQSKK